jgi:hypothetical protein
VARIYDYLLGGKDNFAADREAARQLLDAIPDVAAIARDKRSFLGRVVRYLATEGGVRQFLDLGSGLPTQANVHQLAQGVLGFAPGVHVVYVDNDRCKSGCAHVRLTGRLVPSSLRPRPRPYVQTRGRGTKGRSLTVTGRATGSG